MSSRKNPKIFGSSYQPPIAKSPRLSQSWRPILLVVIAFVGIVLLGRLPIFRIKVVEISGDASAEITDRLDKLVGQSIFSGSVGRAAREIDSRAEIDRAECRRGIPSIIRCQISLKQPHILWKSADQIYYIDDKGVIFGRAEAMAGLLLIEDTVQQPIKLGQTMVSSELITTYAELYDLLKSKNLPVDRLLLSESLYQVAVVINRPDRPIIKALFLMSNDLTSQVDSVVTVLASKDSVITERIDVRVPGYVYVK